VLIPAPEMVQNADVKYVTIGSTIMNNLLFANKSLQLLLDKQMNCQSFEII
jgi:hypothetical protein